MQYEQFTRLSGEERIALSHELPVDVEAGSHVPVIANVQDTATPVGWGSSGLAVQLKTPAQTRQGVSHSTAATSSGCGTRRGSGGGYVRCRCASASTVRIGSSCCIDLLGNQPPV